MATRLTRATAMWHRAGSRLALVGALLTLLAIPAQAGASGVAVHGRAAGVTSVGSDVVPGLSKFENLGPVQASKKILVAITLNQNLNSLYKAEIGMYTKGSPTYHHFLTPAEWKAKYAPPASQVDAIREFGTSQGLELVNPNALYDYVELWGTAAQVESTFHVQLDNFRQSNGQTFFANLQDPTVPAGRGIASVIGLESMAKYHLANTNPATSKSVVTKLAPTAKGMRLTPAVKKWVLSSPFTGPLTPEMTDSSSDSSTSSTQGNCQTDPTGATADAGEPTTLCTGMLSPQAFWNAYDLPTGNPSTEDYGQGQSIGIIGEGQTLDVIAALRQFEATRGLPQVPVQVYHTDPGEDAAESSLDDSGRIEWEMDTQSSTGMAPEVDQVRLYFGSSLSLTELTGAIGTWVNDPNGPLQASASIGACEAVPGDDVLFGPPQRADQALLVQAAMEGRTFFASAGDTGPGCAADVSENGIQYGPIPTEEYPAIDPNTMSVGGTILYTDSSGQRVLERAWDHTGGGPSKFLPQMPWQADAPGASAGASNTLLASNYCPGVYSNDTPFPSSVPGPPYLCRSGNDVSAESGDITISIDHKIGDVYATGGYDPTNSSDNPVQANGIDMVDFCPESEVSAESPTNGGEGPASPDCGYDANSGTTVTEKIDGTSETGNMEDNFAEGGTSLSSPLWLGMWARIQAHHDAGNGWNGVKTASTRSLGQAAPLLYSTEAKATNYARDFYDVTAGASPFPAAPGWDYPTGLGTPNVTPLMDDLTGKPGTAPASKVGPRMGPGGTDPKPIVAPVVSAGGGRAPACTYDFFESNPSATDTISGDDDPNLALVEGDFGLTANKQDLRLVLKVQNMSTTPPSDFTLMDYNVYWTNPSDDTSSNDAVDAEVDAAGRTSFQDGQEETQESSEGEWAFVPSSTSAATGKITDGPDGTVEIDVPLSELGLKVGDTLSGIEVYSSEAEGVAGAQPVNSAGSLTLDQIVGAKYTLGQSTCIDPEASRTS